MLTTNSCQPPCPIDELPTEILEYIFDFGVGIEGVKVYVNDEDRGDHDDHDDLANNRDGAEEALNIGSNGSFNIVTDNGDGPLFQILVSHVCRRWRQVVLNLHAFWTILDFNGTLHLDKAKTFIDRARGFPLKINIDCMPPKQTDEEDPPDHPLDDKEANNTDILSQNDLTQILDLLEPEVSHWGEFIFHVMARNYVQPLLARLHKLPSAPLLKKFQLFHSLFLPDYEFFDANYLPFHGNAPLLESAVFWGIHIDWDNSLPFLQGLREFELSYHAGDIRPSYTTFTQIINKSPNLRKLSLSLSGPTLPQSDDAGQWGPEPFDIPSVHYLELQFHELGYANALVQHFHFPNLRALTLRFEDDDYTPFVRRLLVPVKGRSNSILSGLESLKIAGLPCDAPTVEAMLQQLKKLCILHLNCSGLEETMIFKKLINPLAGRKKKRDGLIPPKIFCPRLKYLTVTLVSDSQLKALVTARKSAGAPLKSLTLSYDDGITADAVTWLKKNVELVEFFQPLAPLGEVQDDDDDSDDWTDLDDSEEDEEDESDDDSEEDEDDEDEDGDST